MAIKPLDLQVMLPKMPEVARIHGTDMERQLMASQRGDIETKQMVDADLKEVRKKKDAQKVTLHEKKEEEKENKKRQKRQGQREADSRDGADPKPTAGGNPERSHFIDIKL